MTELAALGIKATTDGVSKAADELHALTAAAERAENATDRLTPVAEDAGAAIEEMGDGVEGAEGALQRLAAGAGRVLGALAAMAGAAKSVGAYIRMADSWSDMRSQIGAATGDMAGAGDMMQRMTDIANASYSPLDQTVQTYARNVGVLRDLGRTANEAADFTESLNHMLVITATKGERAASVQNALTKAMAVGKLQAEGLETVLAHGGRVAEALAAELGTTVSGLRAFASEGKITGQVIADSLIKNLEEVRDVAADMPATVGDAFTRIGTGMLALVGTFDQAFNISGSLAIALVAVGDGLASLAQSDFAAWADTATDALTGLGQIVLILAATRLPALALSLVSVNFGLLLMNAQFIAGAIAARAHAIALGLAATAGTALGRVVALLGGPWGIAAAAVAAFGIAIYNTRRDGEGLAATLDEVTAAQEGLNTATETYYRELSQQALAAMTLQATAAVDAIRGALKAAQEELSSANTLNTLLWLGIGESDRMAAARAEVDRLATALFEAEARMSGVEHAASNFALRTSEGTTAVVALTAEQDKALVTLNEMNRAYQNRAELASTELQYGRESSQYLETQINQERQIQFAKIAALDITNQQKEAARAAYDLMVMSETATNGWKVELNQVNTSLSASYQYLVKIRDTQPGDGWLSTAISKAASLALKLWDAVAANSALSNLSVEEVDAAGNPIPLGLPSGARNAPKGRPMDLGDPGGTGTGSGTGSGAGSGGAQNALKEEGIRLTERVQQATEAAWSAQEKYNDSVAQADRLLDAGVITLDTYNQHINQLGAELNEVRFENIQKGINDISGAIANAIVNGNDLGEAFNNIVKKMAADLLQSGLQRMINGLFDGARGGGGGGGGLFKFIGSFFANGTPSAPGGLAMVGERGPELVNLAKGSRVHTANDTRRLLSGANQNVSITLHAPAGFTAEQMSQIQGVSVRVVESSIASNNRTQSDQRYLRGG